MTGFSGTERAGPKTRGRVESALAVELAFPATGASGCSSATTCLPSLNARTNETILATSTEPSLLFIRGIDFPLPSKIERLSSASVREACQLELVKSGIFG